MFGIWLPAELPHRVGNVTITRLSDDHRRLVEHGAMWAPRSFTASFDRDGFPLLELDIELVQGRFRCVQLRMQRREQNGYIETDDLRKAPIVRLVRQAVRLVCYFSVELEDQEAVEFVRDAFLRLADLEHDPVDVEQIQVGDFFRYPALAPLLDGLPETHLAYSTVVEKFVLEAERSRPRGTATDEQVAEVYRLALKCGEEVIDAVCAEFHWARQTAKNRIGAVRRAGLLPPTVPGRARA